MRQRTGKSPADVTAKTASAQAREVEPEREFKVTVSLPARQLMFMDWLRNEIRRKTSGLMNQVDTIRAFVEARQASGLDTATSDLLASLALQRVARFDGT